MKTPRRLLTQETPGPASRFRPTAFAARYGAAGAGRDHLAYRATPNGLSPWALWGTVINKQRDWKPGNHGGIFLQQHKECDMNDILDRDYEMGIPFDVDENNERAWARMDESDDEGGKDEE